MDRIDKKNRGCQQTSYQQKSGIDPGLMLLLEEMRSVRAEEKVAFAREVESAKEEVEGALKQAKWLGGDSPRFVAISAINPLDFHCFIFKRATPL